MVRSLFRVKKNKRIILLNFIMYIIWTLYIYIHLFLYDS